IGELVLNRPRKLNAITSDIVRTLWEELIATERVNLFILKSIAGGSVFSAGGDLQDIVENLVKGRHHTNNIEFAARILGCYHRIVGMTRPFISFLDGLTIGAGAAMGAHAAFRIATENIRFSMPEVKIGYSADCGFSFMFSRMDGQFGTFLGLTGHSLKGVDAFYAGVATHYLPSSQLPELERRLIALPHPVTHDQVNQTIEVLASRIELPPSSFSPDIRRAIDRCFKFDTVRAIMAALKNEESQPDKSTAQWAHETRLLLESVCPTSLVVTLANIRHAATRTLGQCLQQDFVLYKKLLIRSDFYQGVRMIGAREKPKWNPATLDDLDEASTVAAFLDGQGCISLKLTSTVDFMEYPHRHYMLPSELHVKQAVLEAHGDSGMISDILLHQWNGKHGVKEKVNEILDRKTKSVGNGPVLEWLD
ncbi:ClpP/crotonase-like domain-containing protein, partial [Chlamydoabsidia padenii]